MVPVNGGSPVTLASLPSGFLGGTAIAADRVSLVFAATSAQGGAPYGIYHLSLGATCAGSTCQPVVTVTSRPRTFVLDKEWLYWTSDDGQVQRMKKTGGCEGITPCPNVLATDQNEPTALAIHTDQVYWTNAGDGTIRKSSIYRSCRGPRCQAIVSGLGRAVGLVRDPLENALYIASRGVLASGSDHPTGVIYKLAE
jgi:hypothetical protein